MFPFPFKNNVRKSKIRALKQEEYSLPAGTEHSLLLRHSGLCKITILIQLFQVGPRFECDCNFFFFPGSLLI